MGPGVLEKVLAGIPKFDSPDVLVGFDTSDDACVYRIREDLVAVQTVDFFTPIVDDPYLFGQIAAANSLSDIYAMGGSPALAMNLICFPDCLPIGMLGEILSGGADKVREAGAVIAGGHTVTDDIPKYGLCVSAFMHPKDILRNNTAREGDLLILTKPIGLGIISTAVKGDLAEEPVRLSAERVMATLNRFSRDAMVKYDVSACTDVTGFGLIGHAVEMAAGSGWSVELYSDSVPVIPGVRELAEIGLIPVGTYNNIAHFKDQVALSPAVSETASDILFDPQTSGGLLIAVSERDAGPLLRELQCESDWARVVGKVIAKEERSILVR